MKQSKYPFLLVHGMFFKDFFFIKSFGNVEAFLREEGYRVYTSLHDAMGSSENNAYQIKEQIEYILKEEKCDKINLIGYSKGGLDIAYLAEYLGIEDKIASITMLAVPFNGSVICDLSLSVPYPFFAPFVYFINFVYSTFFLDNNPDCLACFKLMSTPKDGKRLYEDANFPNKIYTQSYTTETKSVFADMSMFFPAFLMKYFIARHKKFDGFLVKDTAIFANYRGDAVEGVDYSHTQIADFLTSKRKKKKMFEFWVRMINDLIEKGY